MKLQFLFPPDGAGQESISTSYGAPRGGMRVCNIVGARAQQSDQDGKSASFINMERDCDGQDAKAQNLFQQVGLPLYSRMVSSGQTALATPSNLCTASD
jgi:hypothetical protein